MILLSQRRLNINASKMLSLKSLISLIGCFISSLIVSNYAMAVATTSVATPATPNQPPATIHEFDLCSDTSRFDFRNAYWLAVLSEYSYLKPEVMTSIVTGQPGATITEIPTFDKKGKPVSKAVTGLALASNKNDINFYTSPKLKLGEMTTFEENIHTRWVTPLPFEACIRPECWECFSNSNNLVYNNNDNSVCEKKCGYKNMRATHKKEDLLSIINKLKAKETLTSEQVLVKNQIDKYINKFYSMPKFAGKTLEINGVPIWSDPKTADRCDQFNTARRSLPDTQGYIIESEKSIFVIFRGTEDVEADTKMDTKALEKVTDTNYNNIKGSMHKGFYLSHVALKEFIKDSLTQKLKAHPHKSVFITGHSLGGAIGHLTLNSLLSSKSFAYKDNLKALYTYGTPRIGDQEYGINFLQQTQQHNVGVYSLMDVDDVIPHIPCIEYHHATAMINLSTNKTNLMSKAEYHPGRLNRYSGLLFDSKSCGYFEIAKHALNFKKAFDEHRISRYITHLSDLREQLLSQNLQCASDSSNTNYNNIKLPNSIKINFQKLNPTLE